MKRFFGTIFVGLMSGAFLFVQYFLRDFQSVFYQISEKICTGRFGLTSADKENVAILIRYIITCSPLLWGYYFSVQKARKAKGKASMMVVAFAAMAFASFLGALIIPEFYYKVFAGLVYWKVDPDQTRIKMVILNIFVCVVAVVLMFVSLYLPEVKKNNDKWFQAEALGKTCGRYVCYAMLAHLIVWFMVSMRSILFDYWITELPDYIQMDASKMGLRSGLLLLFVVQPLLHELAFRGLIFEHLNKGMSPWLSMGISSLLYAVWMGSLELFPYSFLFGIVMCMVYQRTLRIHFPILVHFGVNLIRYLLAGYKLPAILRVGGRISAVEERLFKLVCANSAFSLLMAAGGICVALACLKLFKAE